MADYVFDKGLQEIQLKNHLAYTSQYTIIQQATPTLEMIGNLQNASNEINDVLRHLLTKIFMSTQLSETEKYHNYSKKQFEKM